MVMCDNSFYYSDMIDFPAKNPCFRKKFTKPFGLSKNTVMYEVKSSTKMSAQDRIGPAF